MSSVNTCTICSDEVRLAWQNPHCQHRQFCFVCIKTWGESTPTCPVCHATLDVNALHAAELSPDFVVELSRLYTTQSHQWLYKDTGGFWAFDPRVNGKLEHLFQLFTETPDQYRPEEHGFMIGQHRYVHDFAQALQRPVGSNQSTRRIIRLPRQCDTMPHLVAGVRGLKIPLMHE